MLVDATKLHPAERAVVQYTRLAGANVVKRVNVHMPKAKAKLPVSVIKDPPGVACFFAASLRAQSSFQGLRVQVWLPGPSPSP